MFAMHKAARDGDLETVRQLIEEGVSVDSRDDKGRTTLHVAATWGQYNVVQLLISSKCDINALDHQGSTPVLYAASTKEKHVTDLLLRHGAQVNRDNPDHFSLLHKASENGWADTVQHILSVEEEVDVDAMTRGGQTPLMLAACAHTRLEECAEILLRAGADPNRKDEDKHTALHYAAILGCTSVVRLLLSVEGLDINPQDFFGRTPLHLACELGLREDLKNMLEAGADYTIIDNNGDTALSEKEYVHLFEDSIMKENVLKDASLCTQSIVNKFHRNSLPALKSISYFAEQLPNIDKFKLNAREIDEVEELVKCEIGRSNFCNVLKVHPMSLKALCILTLITY